MCKQLREWWVGEFLDWSASGGRIVEVVIRATRRVVIDPSAGLKDDPLSTTFVPHSCQTSNLCSLLSSLEVDECIIQVVEYVVRDE